MDWFFYPYVILLCSSLSPGIIFALKSTLSDINLSFLSFYFQHIHVISEFLWNSM